ncbi:unnamed protein product [Schistocephalus solidus]|uniref:Pentatricopeptide repeat-containing protein n=1 Tax=Schistocephalus solidus TaxID=70667 RepID=A0A183SUF2_SCHSO|nr:unnamed protein product [Schistocephalus solidus]
MNLLELPAYVINMPLITAIRQDNLPYVIAALEKYPCLASSLFYTVDEKQVLGLFKGLLQPPTALLLTPFGYAFLFNSKQVLTHLLLNTNTSQQSCFVADCLDAEKRWRKRHRILEIPPLALRVPLAETYRPLMLNKFNFDNPQQINCRVFAGTCFKRSQVVTESVWEMIWSVWPPAKDANILVEFTAVLLNAGCNAKQLVKRINFEKLFNTCKPAVTNPANFVSFLYLVIFHGADLQDTTVLANFLNAIVYLTTLDTQETHILKGLFIAVYNLSSGCSEYPTVVGIIKRALKIEKLSRTAHHSLKFMCIRRIRRLIDGAGFFRAISKMNIDKECKYALLTGIPTIKANKEDAVQQLVDGLSANLQAA